MNFQCMPAKDFKALFPQSWQQIVNNCIKDGVSPKKTENAKKVDVYLWEDGDVYEASLCMEEK